MVRALQEPMRLYDFAWPERFSSRASAHGVLCYFDTQTAEKGRGAPLVFLHALGTNFTQWRHVAEELAPHRRLIGVDLPGCGHSVKTRRPWQLTDMTQAVLGLLADLQIERACLAGHSFGGRVALELALRHPERVSGLLLLNSAGLMRYPPLWHRLGPRLLKPWLVAPVMVALAVPILSAIVAHPSSPSGEFAASVQERFRPEFAWDFAAHACPLLPALLSDVVDEVTALRLPIEVVWGANDRLLRFSRVQKALDRLPGARLTLLSDCGHMPNFEAPAAVAHAALRLFARVDGP